MTKDRQGAYEQDNERNTLQRRLLLVPFCVAVFSLSALFYYHLRQDVIAVQSPLQVTYAAIYSTFGFAPSLMFFLLLLIWTSIWFFTGKVERPWGRLFRLLATTVMLGVFLNVGETGAASVTPQQGELGAFFAVRMVSAFGYYPTLILVLVATLGALLLATDFLFSETFERLWARSTDDDDDEAAAAADVGVEVAVTDHLKGLAAAASPAIRPAARSAGQADAPRAPTVEVDSDEGVRAEAHEFADPEAEVEPAIDDPLPDTDSARSRRRRRLSYFERRFEDAQRLAGGAGSDRSEVEAGQDDWVPAAPEAQEFDNPELSAAGAAGAVKDMLDRGGEGANPAFGIESVGDEDVDGDDSESDDYEGEPVDDAAEESDTEAVGSGEDDAEQAAYGEVDGQREAAEDDDDIEGEADYADDLEDDVEGDIEDEIEDDLEDGLEDDVEDDLEDDVDEDAEDDLEPEAAEAETEAPEPDAAEERVFAIPRPDPRPEPEPASRDSGRQQKLFGGGLDEDLIVEARQVVLEARRASASFLRRRLRIGYDEACEVLAELSARGVVELGDDESQARVIEP